MRARSKNLSLSLAETRHLHILEEGGTGRQSVNVQERRVEDPVTSRGRIGLGPVLVSAVVLAVYLYADHGDGTRLLEQQVFQITRLQCYV